jgi:hypothetical protein
VQSVVSDVRDERVTAEGVIERTREALVPPLLRDPEDDDGREVEPDSAS